MEKFTKFRDPGTGIAPFLPIAPDSRTPLILPLQLALCVIRVPLLILVLGFEVLFVEVIGELAIRPILPILTAWLRWIFLRILLFVFGIVAIDEQIDGVSKSQRKLAIPPKAGNLITSNFTSPFDVIYLAAKYDPVFLSCFQGSNKVEPTSFLVMLWRSLRAPVTDPPQKATLLSLDEAVHKFSDRILVVFPETTPTNGRALLTFSPAFNDPTPTNLIIYAFNIKYTPSDITLPTPYPWTCLWRAVSFIKHNMRVRITHRPISGSDLRDAMCRAGRIRTVGLGPKEKIEFLSAWKRKR